MSHKILVIDDEPSICMLLDNFLAKTYEVICKYDGLEALRWLEGNLPDLIICDIQMPNMDGYIFLEKLRQRGFTKHTPVIMLSGKESSKERVRCYQLGAQDFLAKPFTSEQLLGMVTDLLNSPEPAC